MRYIRVIRSMLFALLLCISINSITAQSFTIDNGLSQNAVTAIIEDSRGYLWISTYDGLNLYDGDEFKIIRNSVDSIVLNSNRVRALYEDKKQRIWIGTENGINILDLEHHRFSDIEYKEYELELNGNTVKQFLETKNGDIIVLYEDYGVAVFDQDGEIVKFDKIEGLSCNDIIDVTDNQFLISSSVGVYLYDMEKHSYTRVFADKIVLSEGLAYIASNCIGIATSKGVERVNYSTKYGKLEFNLASQTLYKDYSFKNVFCDSRGALWLGTLGDGVIYLPKDGNANEKPYFKTNRLRSSCFCEASNNKIWVGTFSEGFAEYPLQENPFKTIDINGLERYRTMELLYIDNDNIILNINTIPPLKYTISTKETKKILPEEFDNQNTIICTDNNKGIWVVANNGRRNSVYYLDQNYRLTPYSSNINNDLIPVVIPKAIEFDYAGNLWMVFPQSVYRMNFDHKSHKYDIQKVALPKINNKTGSAATIYSDPIDNSLWITSSTQGLYHLTNVDSKSTKDVSINHFTFDSNNHNSIPSDFSSAITRSHDGKLWIGTEYGGLCKYDENEKSFERFTSEKNGIISNNIKSIISDSLSNLWIATNLGISYFDTKENKSYNYKPKSNNQTNVFRYPVVQIGETLILAGDNSCVSFNTADIKRDEDIPPVQFGEIQVMGERVNPGTKLDGKVLFDARLKDGDTITLNYTQNQLSIDIDALHFATHDDHFIRYKLLPVNKNWITVKTTQSTLQFSGLAPDNYKLLIEASNQFGAWGETKTLYIEITPPFWRTTTAYIIYIILLFIIIYIGYKIAMRFEKMRHNVEIEQIEKENMTEKQRYFSNIAHEIKTPLALMLAPVDSLSDTFSHDSSVRTKLKRIEVQLHKITQLIDVAQSIQLSDNNLLKPKPTVFEFNSFMDSILTDFKFLASHDKKNLDVNSPDTLFNIKADRSMVEKIINNLINNALKYTSINDTINVNWSIESENILHLEVIDSGMGIANEDLPRIFDRYYRGVKASPLAPSGTGIGLSFSKLLTTLHEGELNVESELQKGSKFTLKLPVISQEEVKDFTNMCKDLFIYDDLQMLENMEASEFSGSLVYVVEDNTEMRIMVENIVKRFYRVECFASGEEALEALQSNWPDLIISDVMMLEIDGFELCQRVKNNIATSHIPVILLTALTAFDDKIKGMEYGADLYMAKPFYPKYLITCIESTLRSRAKLRDRFKSGAPLSITNSPEQSEHDTKFIEKLYKLMEENYTDEDIDINIFARELGVNRTHFFQKVKALTGFTPFDLIKDFRLLKSAELLAQGKYTIEDVCVMAGFKSRTHFSKLFKDIGIGV